MLVLRILAIVPGWRRTYMHAASRWSYWSLIRFILNCYNVVSIPIDKSLDVYENDARTYTYAYADWRSVRLLWYYLLSFEFLNRHFGHFYIQVFSSLFVILFVIFPLKSLIYFRMFFFIFGLMYVGDWFWVGGDNILFEIWHSMTHARWIVRKNI